MIRALIVSSRPRAADPLRIFVCIAASLFAGCLGGENATRDDCRDACSDDLTFFDCVDGSVVRECNDACAVEPISLVEDFNSCADNAAACGDVSCLALLDVDASGRETDAMSQLSREGCKDSCNDMTECSVTSETSDCLSACETVSISDADAFRSCVRITNSCDENRACYTTLGL